jgi:hypothetical protein
MTKETRGNADWYKTAEQKKEDNKKEILESIKKFKENNQKKSKTKPKK